MKNKPGLFAHKWEKTGTAYFCVRCPRSIALYSTPGTISGKNIFRSLIRLLSGSHSHQEWNEFGKTGLTAAIAQRNLNPPRKSAILYLPHLPRLLNNSLSFDFTFFIEGSSTSICTLVCAIRSSTTAGTHCFSSLARELIEASTYSVNSRMCYWW